MADFLVHLLKISPPWVWLAYTAAALVQVVLVLTVVLVSAAVFIWMERKVAGRIQDRLGPTRVGGRFGWLQSPADGLKLLCKEDIIPAGADRLLFRLAPYISFCRAVHRVVWPCRLPTAGWPSQLDSAAFFVLAVAGLEVFGVILGGYASASKWSLYGAMREAAQVVSYEIPLGTVRRRPGAAGRQHGPGRHRQRPGRLGRQLVPLPRPVHLLHLLDLRRLRHGRRRTAPPSTCPRRKANWSPAS